MLPMINNINGINHVFVRSSDQFGGSRLRGCYSDAADKVEGGCGISMDLSESDLSEIEELGEMLANLCKPGQYYKEVMCVQTRSIL